MKFIKDCHAGKKGDTVPPMHPSELAPLVTMGFVGEDEPAKEKAATEKAAK